MLPGKSTSLKGSVAAVCADALAYHSSISENVLDPDAAIASALLMREFGAGLDTIDTLFDRDGTGFRSSACQAVVRGTLVEFFHTLKGQFPMMRWRAANVIDLIDELDAGGVEA